MSRRKQSNPKPLKAGEEEEWGSEGEAEVKRANTPSGESKSSPPPPATSPASTREESTTPKLRLNPSLATDPAVRAAHADGEPVDVEYLANALPSTLHSALAAGGRFFCLPPIPADYIQPQPRIKSEPVESKQANVPVYTCAPCGIRFSSLSTLEAHQTYYCSHRHSSAAKSSATGGAESEAEDLKPNMESREDASGGESSTSEPAPKTLRSGKQYRCPHCSYSADKKVSLNRHMRMHSSSPASQTSVNPETPEAAVTSLHLVDRYCQDCDIRFSSLKTFRAHKLHYCSTRHVIKTNKPCSAPSSPTDSRTTPTSPGASDTSTHPQQPFLALPTNPTLIIPYTLFQGASILPASTVIGQDTVYTLLPDGNLQPVAQGVLGHGRFPQHLAAESGKAQRPPAPTETQVPKVTEESSVKSGPSEGSKPLDLSCRRSIEHELEMEEDEKENRRSVDNHINIFPSPDPEDIICAPSIPLMLSTSSTCSSPSPAPVSPALSSSSYSTGARRSCVDTKRQRLDSQSNSPSPKSSLPDTKSPHRTPNGLANVKTIKSEDSKRKTPEDIIPPKNESQSNLNISNLLLAAAQSHHMDMSMKPDMSSLPFPSELLSQLSAINTRLAGKSSKPVAVPGLIPASSIPLLVPQQLAAASRPPSELINPATILPLLTSEMALRFAAASAAGSEIPTVQVPQVLVKQGVSKCQECNIVFCKHENYVAHKKHYCSARQIQDTQPSQEETSTKSVSPTASTSPPASATSPVNSKETAPSPVSASSSVNISVASTSKPTLYQFICAACGIKFTSYDNLTAHQMYYCPKRVTTETDKTMRRCPKCKINVPTDQLSNHQCGGLVSGWKCPCCPVVSPTASAAQKHMDTHSSVKAFLCTICRYKGNTLRGMRTHIRMHFEKRSTEIMEENYITCVLEDGSGGKIEVTPGDHEDNSTMKSVDESGSCNGESVRIKEERVKEVEEDEEYIEVEDLNTVKSEPLPIIAESESRIMKQSSPNDKRKKSNAGLSTQWCASNKRLNGCNEVLAHEARGPIVL